MHKNSSPLLRGLRREALKYLRRAERLMTKWGEAIWKVPSRTKCAHIEKVLKFCFVSRILYVRESHR